MLVSCCYCLHFACCAVLARFPSSVRLAASPGDVCSSQRAKQPRAGSNCQVHDLTTKERLFEEHSVELGGVRNKEAVWSRVQMSARACVRDVCLGWAVEEGFRTPNGVK